MHSVKLPDPGRVWHIRLCCRGHLDDWIHDHWSDLTLCHLANQTSLLCVTLGDLAAVYGFILQCRDLGLDLIRLHIDSCPN